MVKSFAAIEESDKSLKQSELAFRKCRQLIEDSRSLLNNVNPTKTDVKIDF